MIINLIPFEKWNSLPIAGEVREQVNDMKVDDILIELGYPPNAENRFAFKAQLLNRFIEENGLNHPFRNLLEKTDGKLQKVVIK